MDHTPESKYETEHIEPIYVSEHAAAERIRTVIMKILAILDNCDE